MRSVKVPWGHPYYMVEPASPLQESRVLMRRIHWPKIIWLDH